MNTPWIVGILFAMLFFAVFEALAFRHPDRLNTLSRTIYTIGQTWPLSIWIMGVFAGGLAVHFFWHWCPDMGQGVGLLQPQAYIESRMDGAVLHGFNIHGVQVRANHPGTIISDNYYSE